MYEYFLKQLRLFSKISSPSSMEENIQKTFSNEIQNYVDTVDQDAIGNVIAFRKGTLDKRIMIIAHGDEIGMLINYISNDGFLSFQPIGGIDETILQGQRVIIKHNEGNVIGVIGKFETSENRNRNVTLKYEQLWIDIGATSKDDALKMVSLGDYATFYPTFECLPNGIISAKSLDNRVGLTIICDIAKRLSNEQGIEPSIYFVSSVQEEIGSRGAITTAYNIQPDISITIDVTFASDYPSSDPKKRGDIKLSGGPVISLGADVDIRLQKILITRAEKGKIPYQIGINGRTSCTDASKIQISRNGVYSGILSIPCRYMHSPIEMVSLNDMYNASKLLFELIKSYKEWR